MAAMTKTLKRLAELDAVLAGEGITARQAAQRWGISAKTLRRDVAILRELGCEIPPGGKQRFPHVFRYADRRRRVFSKWVSGDS